jgi:hypothetical protein
MKKIMKKRVLAIAMATMLLMVPVMTFASDVTGIGTANPGLGEADVKDIVKNIITVILGFLGLVSVVIILIGGFMWMTAGGNEERLQRAEMDYNGVVGLIIILAAYAIASWVITTIQGEIVA